MVNQANLRAAIDAEVERRYHLTPEERDFAELLSTVWIVELKARAKRAEIKKNAAGVMTGGEGECQAEKPDMALV